MGRGAGVIDDDARQTGGLFFNARSEDVGDARVLAATGVVTTNELQTTARSPAVTPTGSRHFRNRLSGSRRTGSGLWRDILAVENN